MITFLTEMLELPNHGHMTASAIEFDSRKKMLLMMSWTDILTSYPLLQNFFVLERPRVVIFANIIKALIMFIKTIFKESKKLKRIGNYVSKCNLENAVLYFLILQNLLISSEEMLMSADIVFGSFLGKVKLYQVSSVYDMCDK